MKIPSGIPLTMKYCANSPAYSETVQAKASAFGDSPGRLSFYSLHESRKKVSHVTLLFVMLKNYSRRFAWSRSFQFLGITLFSAYDLQVDRQAEKGCILNSRILWFFSEAAMLTGRADAACAHHAYQWFEDHCFDRENGGVYWSCDALGRPLDTTKHTSTRLLPSTPCPPTTG